jgi:hypothetical protein
MSMGLTGIIVFMFVVCMFVACAMLIGAITLYVVQKQNNDLLVQFKIHALVAEALNSRTTHTYPCGHTISLKDYVDTDGDCPACEMDKDLVDNGYLWVEEEPDLDGMFDLSDEATCLV